MSTPGSKRRPREGFSLLEVILALAILTGAIAVLGEAARLGLRNAQIARDMTQAQLLCESKLAEIAAGITAAETVSATPFELSTGDGSTLDQSEITWLYSIDVNDVTMDGLLAISVTVVQDLPEEKRPLRFMLTRWTADPGIETSESSASGGDRE